MPHARNRNPSPIPEVTWDTGLKEMNETWKGAIACLGVAIFFVMTIGIIYWQVVDQPNKNWILRGGFSGLIWERRTHSLVIQTLAEDKTFVEIDVGNVETSDTEIPFVRNLCWLNKTEFCYTWDSIADVKIALESDDTPETECYSITWTALHCQVDLKDCFSMGNVSWYGGASVQAQNWPINAANTSMQPFTVGDLRENPGGYGSVLERYFLGSSGVAVLADPELPLHVGFESRTQFCLRAAPGTDRHPLRYSVCVGRDLKSVHQEVGRRLHPREREAPNLSILRLPFWKLLAKVDSGAKVEREIRTFSNRLRRHQLGEGVISLNEHSSSLLSDTDHEFVSGRRRTSKRQTRTLPMVRLLNISVTLSPYLSVDSRPVQTSLQDGTEGYWLSAPTAPHGHMVPLLTQWKGKFCVKLNLSNPAAGNWFQDRVEGLQSQLDAEFVILEGGAGAPRLPSNRATDQYIRLLAALATKVGDSTVVTAGTRSSDVPLFIGMTPLRGDWSSSGLKGIIPSVLHYSLLGYSFFLPDAVGGSLSRDLVTDEELFIRWLEISSFLPVLTFHTPPWVCGEDRLLNLTRFYISKHQDFVVPLIVKYTSEWQRDRSPIYRPLWWISPDDPYTYTIDDQFLIGDEVLVAPVTERGALQRDIYLPGNGLQWQDTSNARVFDGGTFLENYPVGLEDVAVFTRRSS